MNDFSRFTATMAVLAFTLMLLLLFLPVLGYGLPSDERLAVILGGEQVTPEMIRRMASGENELARIRGPSNVFFYQQKLSEDEVDDLLRAIRRMCLYTTEPDEMQMFLALGRMRPAQFDFNPHFYQYGGGLIYGSAAMILLAGLLGLVPLSGGLTALLGHPSLVANAYMAARFWPFLVLLFLPAIAYRLARNLFDRQLSVLAALTAIMIPGLFHIAISLKPQQMALTIGLLGLACSLRALRRPSLKRHIQAGLAYGFSAGVMITMAPCFIAHLAVLMLGLRRDYRTTLRSACGAILAAMIAFFLVNPYWILAFDEIVMDMQRTASWFQPIVSLERFGLILIEVVPVGISSGVLIGGLCGFIYALLAGPREARILSLPYAVVLLFNLYQVSGSLLTPGWSRYFILLQPLGVLLAASACLDFFRRRGRIIAATMIFLLLLGVFPRAVLAVANLRADGPGANTRYMAGQWIAENVFHDSIIYLTGVPQPATTPFVSYYDYHFLCIPADLGQLVETGIVAVVRPDLDVESDLIRRGWRPIKEFAALRTLFGLPSLETKMTEYAPANPTITLYRKN